MAIISEGRPMSTYPFGFFIPHWGVPSALCSKSKAIYQLNRFPRKSYPSKYKQIHDCKEIFRRFKNSTILFANVSASNSSKATKPRKYSFTTFKLSIVRLFRSRTTRITIDNCCLPLISFHSPTINA